MKAKHAAQIRLGIKVARMDPFTATMVILNTSLPRLSSRAFRREMGNVLKRMLHPMGQGRQ